MARSSNSNDKISKTPTEDTIEKCKRELCEEKIAVTSSKNAKCTDVETKYKEKRYKTCCLVKARETNHQYWNLDFCVTTGAVKESVLIKDGIKSLLTKNGELEKLLKDTAKTIKEVKTKLNEALDAACKFERCVEEEERCNPEILKALTQGVPDFVNKVKNFKSHATDCYDKVSKGFDASVNISGIQTFSNLNSLTPFGDRLCELTEKYKGNLEENVKYSEGQVKESQTALTECLQELATSKAEKCKAISEVTATEEVYRFVCDPDCPDDCYEKIKCICGDPPTMPPGTGTNDCDDDDDMPPMKKDGKEWNM